MKTHKTQLEAKVGARNAVNAFALEKVVEMVAALEPFIGQKILNQGDLLSAKVKAALPDTECSVDRHYWYSANRYSVYANFKTSQCSQSNHPDTQLAGYAEISFCLGEIEGGKLIKVQANHVARTDYTVAEVLQARLELKAAQEALSKAQSKLAGFGEFDN
jgi:exosome complex RNA-binding protein Rrp4